MKVSNSPLPYPRMRVTRGLLRALIRLALGNLTDITIEGKDNLPRSGPLLVVANHFSFLDPLAMIYVSPWPMEFFSGSVTPNAPRAISWLRNSWGVLPVYRGTASRSALRSAEGILQQNGVVGIFPEAGNWATVLRPARPGSAFVAARTEARILPMAFIGLVDVFKELRRGRRAEVQLKIGKPFGPFRTSGRGRERRQQLDEIGHRIMENIADLLPDRLRGYYAHNPATRAAAKGTEIYPWDIQ